MPKQKRNLSKIVHIDLSIHNKLKRFVTDKQINGERTSLAVETEKAILQHIANEKAA